MIGFLIALGGAIFSSGFWILENVILFVFLKMKGSSELPMYIFRKKHKNIAISEKVGIYSTGGEFSFAAETAGKVRLFKSNSLGLKGEEFERDEQNIMIFPAESKENTLIIENPHLMKEFALEKVKAAEEEKVKWFNLAHKYKMELTRLESDWRRKFNEFKQDHKDVNRSGPMVSSKVGGK